MHKKSQKISHTDNIELVQSENSAIVTIPTWYPCCSWLTYYILGCLALGEESVGINAFMEVQGINCKSFHHCKILLTMGLHVTKGRRHATMHVCVDGPLISKLNETVDMKGIHSWNYTLLLLTAPWPMK